MTAQRHAYPILLDLTGRLVVIVGGGAVAVRKATGVLDADAARVRCVAPTFHADLPGAVERVAGRYEARHLDGAELVFAATDDPAVNDAVVRDARALGVLVSRADNEDREPGDFITPAVHRAGPVTVAVSAGGSPALAAAVRDGIAARWDERWTRMAEAMQELRPKILAAELAADLRRQVFRDLATEEAMTVVAREGLAGLMKWLNARHPPLKID